ncbi:SGNH/GDSL hydrolase family protein [Anaerosacchariphilus polymeriproducens]|uniref:SGNH/GDSL hydrolase family protein n=1 Tax=Anaerosacchariphilus polymeriproducens TaxID=1812858 RepID=UPI00138FA08D|nr:SGNH/GDSL hydrolase family protein [Anaerosacchariphilus polymeriproducens]
MEGLINVGNLYRFKKVFEKAEKGRNISVGFIGGSITRGALSSSPEKCYAHLVWRWWGSKFPTITVKYINAGIGATTSQFGVARVEKDLLVENPDIVFVEFSVNDEGNEFFQETYEGLIRKIYGYKSKPAIILINNMYYDTGKTAQEFHNSVGKAYQLPIVSIKESLYKEVVKGTFQVRDLTNDMLHPNDLGHYLVAKIICEFLEELVENTDKEWVEMEIPAVITPNRFENSIIINNLSIQAKMKGFKIDLQEQIDMSDVFRKGWYADEKGAYIELEVYGSNVAVQYRKTINKPAPVASVSLDGCEVCELDGNYEEDWGDCLYLQMISTDLERCNHKVRFEIKNVNKENITPFYIVSLIVS